VIRAAALSLRSGKASRRGITRRAPTALEDSREVLASPLHTGSAGSAGAAHSRVEGAPSKRGITMKDFETISLDQMNAVNGGNDLVDAAKGAWNIFSSPVGAVYRGVRDGVGAYRQGHSLGDSVANGLVQAGGIQSVPNLANMPNPARR
jgi:hypothetical protein